MTEVFPANRLWIKNVKGFKELRSLTSPSTVHIVNTLLTTNDLAIIPNLNSAHSYNASQWHFFPSTTLSERLDSAHPEIAPFGSGRCSRSIEILDVAGYAHFALTATLSVSNSLEPRPEPQSTISRKALYTFINLLQNLFSCTKKINPNIAHEYAIFLNASTDFQKKILGSLSVVEVLFIRLFLSILPRIFF